MGLSRPLAATIPGATERPAKQSTADILLRLAKERLQALDVPDSNPLIRRFAIQDAELGNLRESLNASRIPTVATSQEIIGKVTATSAQQKAQIAQLNKDIQAVEKDDIEKLKQQVQTELQQIEKTIQTHDKLMVELLKNARARNDLGYKPYVTELQKQGAGIEPAKKALNQLERTAITIDTKLDTIDHQAHSTSPNSMSKPSRRNSV